MGNIYEKLAKVQTELKAPKGQYNTFGKYKYRSAEDIIEAAKPLCVANGLLLNISDDIVYVGERYYIKATATVTDIETESSLSVYAFAREAADKKGMDDSQVTGTASSYARKYAMNGLFAIDDTKDADTDEYAKQNAGKSMKERAAEKNAQSEKKIKEEILAANEKCIALLNEAGLDPAKVAAAYKCQTFGPEHLAIFSKPENLVQIKRHIGGNE